ncbi:hypothetical protein IW262DRAFT_1302820 [Armillaria fumosa]|nr:hypothetical protein IW262DRAFT_1302820 [Armillaria fumosa]
MEQGKATWIQASHIQEPAPLPAPPASRNAMKNKVKTKPNDSKRKLPKKAPKKPTKPAIVVPPAQQHAHGHRKLRKVVSSDDEDLQPVPEDKDEDDSEDDQDDEIQEVDSLPKLRKRKRSPTSHDWLGFDERYRNFMALMKYYRLASRNIARFINLWSNVQGIVLHGFMVKGILKSLAEDEEENSGDDSNGETKEPDTPDQLEDLDSNDPLKAVFEIFAVINAGAHSGRSDDTTKISDNIMRLSTKDLTNETLLPILKKYQHGFNHIHMACLLCPQHWLEEFENNPVAMMVKLQTKVMTQYLPSYLYDPDLVDSKDPCRGLFQGHTCIQSFHAIYLGNPEHDASELHSTVKGKMNLEQVTPEMIVYAVVQAQFALSSCMMWGDQSDGFDLRQYNNKLTKILLDSANKVGDTWAADIVEFYTTEILKPKTDDNQEQVDDDDNELIMDQNCEACIKE